MTEQMSDEYKILVAEAFIDPIRSVLIVDDDYPTLDEILSEKIAGTAAAKHASKSWRQSPQDVIAVVQEFRQPHGGPYILDIHDGDMPPPGTDEHQAHRLQQTDLLVLDYELNGTIRDGGRKALAIARKALTNKHFNIILVHTREPLAEVFGQFLIGLLQPSHLGGDAGAGTAHQPAIDEHLDHVSGLISDAAYLALRASPDSSTSTPKATSGPMGPIHSYINENVDEAHRGALLREATFEFERKAEGEDRFSDVAVGVRKWRAEGRLWIRCDQGFIAFKEKGDGEPLLQTLRETLVSWGPYPSRLLLTKLRAEMNERGIEVQDDALGDRAVGAAWFHDLVDASDAERAVRVEQVVRNHSEQLLDQLLPQVADYAGRLANAFEGGAAEAVRMAFDRFDMEDATQQQRAVIGRNAFAASKPVGGVHLEFGHVLEIDGVRWICMTPACDMVPEVRRNKDIEPDDLEGCKRFTALRLHEVAADGLPKKLKRAHEAKEHVFVNIAKDEGGTEAIVFALSRQPNAAPATVTMYATEDGRFSEGTRRVTVRYVSTKAVEHRTGEASDFELVEKEAIVRGHLRYEYALHVQAMFAQGQSRIGLDFKSTR